jgi:hypothetical protein
MAYLNPNELKDNNVFHDETFSIPSLDTFSMFSILSQGHYRNAHSLGQLAWAVGNAWVYNFCKDICTQMREKGRPLTERQLEVLEKNLEKAQNPKSYFYKTSK